MSSKRSSCGLRRNGREDARVRLSGRLAFSNRIPRFNSLNRFPRSLSLALFAMLPPVSAFGSFHSSSSLLDVTYNGLFFFTRSFFTHSFFNHPDPALSPLHLFCDAHFLIRTIVVVVVLPVDACVPSTLPFIFPRVFTDPFLPNLSSLPSFLPSCTHTHLLTLFILSFIPSFPSTTLYILHTISEEKSLPTLSLSPCTMLCFVLVSSLFFHT